MTHLEPATMPPRSQPALDVPPEIPLDAAGRVDAEVQCRRCGYVLMRQLPDADCPECGHAVIDSLRGGVLRFTDPRYLDRLWSGVGIMIGYVVAWFLCLILGWVFAMLVGPWGLLVWGIPPLVLTAAVWRLTSFDPGRSRGEQPNRWRVAARAGAVVACLMLALTGGVPLLEMSSYAGSGLSEAWLLGSAGVFECLRAISKAFAFVGLLVCVRYVAKRVPSRALATQATVLAWGFAVAGAVGLGGKLFYGGAILLMFNNFNTTLTSVSSTTVSPPTRPTASPIATTTHGGETVETWEVKRADGSRAELKVTTDAAGKQQWEEKVYDSTGFQTIAWCDVYVDSNNNQIFEMADGPPGELEFLGPQAVTAHQKFPATSSSSPSSGPVSATAGATSSTAANPVAALIQPVPVPPTRPADTTQQIGGDVHKTWNTHHADGSADIYTQVRMADGYQAVTLEQVAADGSSSRTTYLIDATGQVTNVNTMQSPANSGGNFTGFGAGALLMMIGGVAILCGLGGFAVFFIWLVVLLCLLRPKLREARQFARALATPHFARYA
ncbi:MAG: hypothetical protein GVY24_08425 [Planctomycetes bacterium]|jgi:hypothetical protein|nr:hypothetical protein [Planctomycetota bacterium]